jgi:hypothetical protein
VVRKPNLLWCETHTCEGKCFLPTWYAIHIEFYLSPCRGGGGGGATTGLAITLNCLLSNSDRQTSFTGDAFVNASNRIHPDTEICNGVGILLLTLEGEDGIHAGIKMLVQGGIGSDIKEGYKTDKFALRLVNSEINSDDFPCNWGSFTEMFFLVGRAPPGTQASIYDVEGAFRCVPMRPEDQRHVVIMWMALLYIDHCFCFG